MCPTRNLNAPLLELSQACLSPCRSVAMSNSSSSSPGNWITGGYTGNSDGVRITIATFVGVAWYNVGELMVVVFLTFKKYRGIYFWSMLASAWGIVPYSLGFLLKFLNATPPSALWLPITLLTVGWWAMVTGQSMVLYSRLHLVLRDIRILHLVLGLIVLDVFLLHVPTTVLTYLANYSTTGPSVSGYNIMEKIQLTGFCVQEMIISGLYIWETNRMLKLNPESDSRKIIFNLFAVNMACILMDIALITIEYANFYMYQTTLKATIYSIKLKLEFAVLGKLVKIAHQHVWRPQLIAGPMGYPMDASQLFADLDNNYPTTRAP